MPETSKNLQYSQPVTIHENYTPVGPHVANDNLTNAVALPRPEGASGIIVQAETKDIRYRLDGVNPTTTVGFLIKAGDPERHIAVTGADIRFIQVEATAVLQRQWVS